MLGYVLIYDLKVSFKFQVTLIFYNQRPLNEIKMFTMQ